MCKYNVLLVTGDRPLILTGNCSLDDDVIAGSRPATSSPFAQPVAVIVPPRDGGGVRCMTGNAADDVGEVPEENIGPKIGIIDGGGSGAGGAA